jgi:hypothetical protein
MDPDATLSEIRSILDRDERKVETLHELVERPAEFMAWQADGSWAPVCAGDLPHWWSAEPWDTTPAPADLPEVWYVRIIEI